MKVQFQFMLPSLTLKNVIHSLTLFLVVSGLLCFNIFLITIHIHNNNENNNNNNTTNNELISKSLGSFSSTRISIGSNSGSQNNMDMSDDLVLLPKTNSMGGKMPSNHSTSMPAAEYVARQGSLRNNTNELHCVLSSNSNIATGGAFHFEATTVYRKSKTLPQWMKDYFDWHREQTAAMNECNYQDYKFLILRCSRAEKKCGGVADRLKSLPFFVAMAAYTKRVFLVRWERPTNLEEFLVPNEINWSVPHWLPEKANYFGREKNQSESSNPALDFTMANTAKLLYRRKDMRNFQKCSIMESFVQDYYGGSKYYHKIECQMDATKTCNETLPQELGDYSGWSDYERIYRDLFYTIFQPSPPVRLLVQKKMLSENLIPRKFVAAHYRAFYAIESEKHKLKNSTLERKTRNAISCASSLESEFQFQTGQPGMPIVFASDSRLATLEAKKMSHEHEYDNHKIVVFDTEKEALHLDKRDQGNAADFYPSFVELLVMAEAECISIGIGGYGRFANIMSSNSKCYTRHDTIYIKKMPRPCTWHDNSRDAKAASDIW
uniref:Fucosyltransferase n=1 Tax=Pseudo-nitzschia australis TaxID=44445 RepID=A0A6V0CWX3_9STRA